MNNDQFPHKSAFTNYITSFLKKTEAAKITLRLLNKFGVINVGGKKQSAYNFAKNLNVKIKKSKLSKSNLISLGKNTSLNLSKLNNILKNAKKIEFLNLGKHPITNSYLNSKYPKNEFLYNF